MLTTILLLNTLKRQSIRSNTETKSKPSSVKQVCYDVVQAKDITPVQWALGLAISLMAATLAYRCSPPNTGRIAKTIFALFFSEIYLIQAGMRALIGDWKCNPAGCTTCAAQ